MAKHTSHEQANEFEEKQKTNFEASTTGPAAKYDSMRRIQGDVMKDVPITSSESKAQDGRYESQPRFDAA